jgi:hypothetical protein
MMTMTRIPEQEIRKALSDLPPEDVETVMALVKSLCQKRTAKQTEKGELSDVEHARLLGVLDSVAALSLEHGPAVSNRDHDRDLYGS